MRRILINEKSEFSCSRMKISKSNHGVKMLGSLFRANDSCNSKNSDVIVSNKTNIADKENQQNK